MSLEKSQKTIRVFGIIDIIAAIVILVSAVGMFGLGSEFSTNPAAT